MDLMGRAAAVLPTDGPAAVEEWKSVIAASAGGPIVLAHLDGDLVLETTPNGRAAVERLIEALTRRPAGAGLDNVVCGPRWRAALDPARIVSGYVPAVFSTFSEDRDGRCPVGTNAARVREVLGLPSIDPAEPHLLLHYSRARVGPALVPTAFDAATHEFFVPATAGAECGFTKDLGPSDGVGVREIVVRPFPTASIDTRPESVP